MAATVVSESVARDQLCEYARDIWQRNLSAAADGNLSVRLGRDRLLTTPSGRHKGKLSPSDMVLCDLQGRPIGSGKPSSELAMHVEAYRRRDDVGAVIHAHPPHATAFNLAGGRLSDIWVSEVIFAFGQVASAPYTTPTTSDVPQRLGEYFACYNAVMMARHGSVTLGATLEQAFIRLDALEHTAKVMTTARVMGGAEALPATEVDRLYRVAMGDNQPPYRLEGRACPPLEAEDLAARTGGTDDDEERRIVEAVMAALAGTQGR